MALELSPTTKSPIQTRETIAHVAGCICTVSQPRHEGPHCSLFTSEAGNPKLIPKDSLFHRSNTVQKGGLGNMHGILSKAQALEREREKEDRTMRREEIPLLKSQCFSNTYIHIPYPSNIKKKSPSFLDKEPGDWMNERDSIRVQAWYVCIID